MRNLEANGDVRFKIGGLEMNGKARITGTDESREKGKRALYEKYYGSGKKDVIDGWFSLSKVVEVVPS